LAVRALRALADADRIKGSALAELIGTTPGFVSQVVNPLVKAGWIRSNPGPTGGYSLIVDLSDVSVLAVIEAVEGATETGQCVLADGPCNDSGSCAMHVPWQRARDGLLRELAAVSVADESINVDVGPTP
jgi:Rrf2 family protein